jgi:hypothetical protein
MYLVVLKFTVRAESVKVAHMKRTYNIIVLD